MELKPSKNKAKEIALEVKDVWESFRIYHQRNQTIKDTLVRWKKSVYEEFWALKGVSFKVHKGQALGIIGENGSGKSTLLKCIAGILQPSKGFIRVNGKISPLLELGAGFHPELSGRENIFINGAILGLTKKQIDEKFNKIVEFSELKNFIDNQVKFYSSGMYVRLGFAVAVFSDPDILLIDEVLSVGDESFKKKCFDKIKQFQSLGKTIVLVTHDMGAASQFCDNLILLKNGSVEKAGKPRKVIRNYVDTTIEEEESTERGTKEIVINEFQIIDKQGQAATNFQPGDACLIKINFTAKKEIKSPVFGFAIHDQHGNHSFATNTKLKKIETGLVKNQGSLVFEIQSLPMLDGKYYITLSASAADGKILHWLDNCLVIDIENPTDDIGTFYVPVDCYLGYAKRLGESGTKEIILQNYRILSKNGKECSQFRPGDAMAITVDFQVKKPINNPVFGFAIYDTRGKHCFGTNTRLKKINTGLIDSKGSFTFDILNLPMLNGEYHVTLAVVSSDESKRYHWLDNCLSFEIDNPTDEVGGFYIPVDCKLKKTSYNNLDRKKRSNILSIDKISS